MLRRAYASAYHWARAARRVPANEARAAWLLAKVQLLAGQPELSLRYADRCLSICQQHGLADFDLAYAHEARARALKALGDDIAAGDELGTGQVGADRRPGGSGDPRRRSGTMPRRVWYDQVRSIDRADTVSAGERLSRTSHGSSLHVLHPSVVIELSPACPWQR